MSFVTTLLRWLGWAARPVPAKAEGNAPAKPVAPMAAPGQGYPTGSKPKRKRSRTGKRHRTHK